MIDFSVVYTKPKWPLRYKGEHPVTAYNKFFGFILDGMFASASLDGAIVLWSSLTFSYTRQFNFVKNYEGPCHTYPSSAQHLFIVDQVWKTNHATRSFCGKDVIRCLLLSISVMKCPPLFDSTLILLMMRRANRDKGHELPSSEYPPRKTTTFN